MNKIEAYTKALDEWEAAILRRRPHIVVNALWQIVRLRAKAIHTVPGHRLSKNS